MSISSLVIHTKPDRCPSVQEALMAYDGIEIHAATDDGQLVVTLDQPDEGKASETLFALQNIDGVLNASLVFNYFEETAKPIEEVTTNESL